jgi:hypothetical protein
MGWNAKNGPFFFGEIFIPVEMISHAIAQLTINKQSVILIPTDQAKRSTASKSPVPIH